MGCRKKFAPFQCSYVPTAAIVVFCIQHKAIVESVYQQFNDCRNEMLKGWNHRGRPYCRSAEGHILKALLLLRFNYSDSTLATGDIVYRVMMIYKEYRDKIQHNENSI